MIVKYIGDSSILITVDKKAVVVEPNTEFTVNDKDEIKLLEANKLFVFEKTKTTKQLKSQEDEE